MLKHVLDQFIFCSPLTNREPVYLTGCLFGSKVSLRWFHAACVFPHSLVGFIVLPSGLDTGRGSVSPCCADVRVISREKEVEHAAA